MLLNLRRKIWAYLSSKSYNKVVQLDEQINHPERQRIYDVLNLANKIFKRIEDKREKGKAISPNELIKVAGLTIVASAALATAEETHIYPELIKEISDRIDRISKIGIPELSIQLFNNLTPVENLVETTTNEI
jgi:hypothetical protein